MDQDQNGIEFRLARVTPNGLLLDGNIYTNAKMIRHKWFESARVHGEWDLPVLYNPQNPKQLVLFDMDSMEVASSVENESPKDTFKLEMYFAALNELKHRYFSKKK